MKHFVVQEDTNQYNIFGDFDFNEDGYLIGYENQDGYHMDDFDIVAEFDSFDEAVKYVLDKER